MKASIHHTLPVLLTLAAASVTAGCQSTSYSSNALAANRGEDLGLTDPDYYINLGRELRNNRKPDAAIEAYRQAIRIDMRSTDAYTELGDVFFEQRKLDDAMNAYRRVTQIDPKATRAFTGVGNILVEQKRAEEAVAAYRRALQINPKDAAAYAGLGNALADQRKFSDAIATYQKAIALDPPDDSVSAHTIALSGLGRALQSQNRLDDAIEIYRNAIKLNPKYAWTYLFLGHALVEKKQFDEAGKAYAQALNLPNAKRLKLGDSHAMANNGLGMILQRQGKLKDAIAKYETAIKLDLSYETGHSNLKGAKQLLAKQGVKASRSL